MTEIEELQKRLHNVEIAIVALHGLIQTSMTAETSETTDRMMTDFFNASEKLGAFQHNEFIDKREY